MTLEQKYLLKIIKCVLNENTSLTTPPYDIDWTKLLEISSRHSVSNIVSYGLEKLDDENKPDKKIVDYFANLTMREIMRSCNQIDASEKLLEECEKNEVHILTLKGVNTKYHYPEQDMRSMGDIDVLYKEEEHDKITKVMHGLGYTGFEEGRKHDHYELPPFVQIEMHRELLAAESIYSDYYKNIWDKVVAKEECKYVKELTLEDEFIFTILHLVEHFKNGGIGIRFIMDVYVYNQLPELNKDYVKEEFAKLNLWEFYSNILALANIWFSNEETKDNEILKTLEEYIVQNGTFGSRDNASALQVQKNGNKIRFLLSVCFPSLKDMQTLYSWLKKYPILLPYAWIQRGIRSILYRRHNIKTQLNVYKTGDMEHGKELRKFYSDCGLKN